MSLIYIIIIILAIINNLMKINKNILKISSKYIIFCRKLYTYYYNNKHCNIICNIANDKKFNSFKFLL